MPSAIMKGTDMGPVVAPPASNPMATKKGGTAKARTSTRRYETMSIILRGMWSIVLSSERSRKIPTPAPIETSSSVTPSEGLT